MSGWVKYPFHVRHNGVDYNPGVPIEVEDPVGHVLRGATEVIGMNAETAAPEMESTVQSEAAPRKTAAKGGKRKAAQ